jgi:hypothetical protein
MICGSVTCQPSAANLLQEMCVRKGTSCRYIARPTNSKKIQIADKTIHLIQEALQTKYMSVATGMRNSRASCAIQGGVFLVLGHDL